MKQAFGIKYYTIKEVAQKIDMSYSNVYRWVHERKIPMKQIGKRCYLVEEQINEFIESFK